MNLVAILNGRNIAGVQEDTLWSILQGVHPSTQVRFSGNAMVMLTDNTVIKCVSEYYMNPSSTMDLKKYKNSPALCHYTQESLDVETARTNQCAACHLQCMNKKKNGELVRKYR